MVFVVFVLQYSDRLPLIGNHKETKPASRQIYRRRWSFARNPAGCREISERS
jgi:hypothetical protein